MCSSDLARVSGVLCDAASLADLGPEVAPGLHEAELRFLEREEWACSADDVLWRRSKLGLHYSAAERQQVADWLARQATHHDETRMKVNACS